MVILFEIVHKTPIFEIKKLTDESCSFVPHLNGKVHLKLKHNQSVNQSNMQMGKQFLYLILVRFHTNHCR